MRYPIGQLLTIHLPFSLWDEITHHCIRKLQGNYIPGECRDHKAFGLIGGKVTDSTLLIKQVIQLKKNARDRGEQKNIMDSAMVNHAIPSQTPFDQRGWVAESNELDSALTSFQTNNLRLVGNYHMHRVAWEHDSLRDTPTELDAILGCNSRMFMFIISMVNYKKPIIRAFFEGNRDFELPIEIL